MGDVEVFRTRNSTYEVDHDRYLIRRTEGVNPPTPNQGEDGIWHEFVRLDVLPAGGRAIFWPDGGVTITSSVQP